MEKTEMTVQEGTLVLGKLIVKTRTNKRIEPLFVLVDNAWQAADPEDFKASLPLKAPNDPNVDNNAFVVSELLKSPSRPGKTEEIFKLGPARPADVVVAPKDPETARSVVEKIDELIAPRWAGASTDIFVDSDGGILLGPFRLNRRKLHAPKPARLEMRRAAGMITTPIDGYLVGDRIDRLPVVGYYDSRSDDEIVNSVADLAVSTLSNLDVDEAEMQTAAATLRKIGDWLANRSEDNETLNNELIERTLQACEDAATAQRLAGVVASKLCGLPDVVRLMDQAIEEARFNAERGEQLRIEQKVKQEHERFDDLVRQKLTAQNELEKLRTQVASAQLEFDTAHQAAKARSEEVRADVAVAVEEIIEGSRERLASSVIGRALAIHSPSQTGQVELGPADDVKIRTVSPSLLTSSAAIKKRIRASATQYGLQSIALQRMISAFLAGLIPVTLGNGGAASISTAADIAYSGRHARMPIAHDFLHPTDLVGLHSGKPGTLRSNYQLLSSATAAADSGEVVVVLEQLNQAPTESYLVPWLQNRWNGAELEGIDHTRNIRIAGTIATGVTSARISPDLWGYAVAIETPTLPQWTSSAEYSHIELPEPEQPAANIAEDLLSGVEPHWPITEDIFLAADRFASWLSYLQPDDHVRRSVAVCLLLPAAATSLTESEYREFANSIAKNISMTEEMSLRYSGLVQRLRMRLG
ncbi:hypothetical protein [Rhodococcus sp. IEGM 1374]|uniref:hypothetical protein n=1 Tax=Rhodococcus sp. IEGM 1374 TaxID=3082221 RepID=UPI002954E83B|nr:hypothetical protein [Rhodococcus sp. IEGM 1374]MDV7992137.1 hypothetical protein [Rhodococcus sp. IEGM 1374]